MLPDFHIHTSFSGDSQTPARTQIEQCISLGMKELCITDHHDYDSGMEEEIFLLNFDTYLPALHTLRQEYQNQIQVNIGVELGLQLHVKDYLKDYNVSVTVIEKEDTVHTKGTVFWQSRKAGDPIVRGVEIIIHVAKEPAPKDPDDEKDPDEPICTTPGLDC